MVLGFEDYRQGGLERLAEAGLLLRQDALAGSVYLGGRAVESMLRAVIWKTDMEIQLGRKSLDTGHDLRDLLTLVQNLGVLRRDEHREELAANIQKIARLWFNNMRFVATAKLRSHWSQLKEIRSHRTLKQATASYYDSCSAIVKRCEALCKN
jgi:hypothetical protein